MGWGAEAARRPPCCPVGDTRVPGLMAAAGTERAGGTFAVQEVVLERPRWLDGGCERARRGYLYGQLCCVGGCGCGGDLGALSQRERPGPGRGWSPAQVQPRPRLRSGNTWEGRRRGPLGPVCSLSGDGGWEGGGAGLRFGRGCFLPWAPGSWQSGCRGGRAEGGAPGLLLPWGSPWPAGYLPSVGFPSQERVH